MCRILKVSRSGFYEYLNRKKSKRTIENEALYEIIKDIFEEHKGRYGARRIQLVLEKINIKANHKRIAKIMNKNGLVARGTRKVYPAYPKVKPYEEKENILNQVFEAKEKNKIWVGDITYIKTKNGFLYLSVFIDIFSRKVTGWAMDTRIRSGLVLSSLTQAIGRENPNPGLIVHTDRGSQYTCRNFQSSLVACGFKHSMSRRGNPYDNAVIESFYRTLKRELVKGANYDNPEQARLEIFKYIEFYYNTKRMHSALNYMSPIEYELKNS